MAALADDIAYTNHDLDDGLRAELFTLADVETLPLVGPILEAVAARYPGLEAPRLIHESLRRLIDAMVVDLVEETTRRLAALQPDDVAAIRGSARPVVGFSPKVDKPLQELRGFLQARMYSHYKVKRMARKARRVVRELFDGLHERPDCLPPDWQARAGAGGDARCARGDRRLHRRHDRSVCARRARPSVQPGEPRAMNPFEELQGAVLAAIAACQAAGELPAELATERVTVEPPRDPGHGDAATNAALVLAKPAGRPPLAIAEALAARLLDLPQVETVEIAKPGFVNLRLTDDFWRAQVLIALQAGAGYGAADLGQGRVVNVEYCSANPTGPLHVGHGRGTAFGDALANLLAKMGWQVVREYYVNDGGAQIDDVARSVHHRYLGALGAAPAEPPQGLYPGDYLIPLAGQIAERDGARWREAPESAWLPAFREHAVARCWR